MDFDQILDQAIEMLQRRGRVSYRALKRQFDLEDDYLKDLKDEILYTQPHVVEDGERGLVWPDTSELSDPRDVAEPSPLTYTPKHLTDKILTSRSALEGERKQVTVLFADIKGSTELIRDLDPEEAQKLLDPAIHLMMEAVHRFEGTVNQVLGNGIMALFGAPIAHEDHAARACYAALAMQAAMRHYTDEVRHSQGIEMHIRVGLNSGEVVVRTIGNDLHMDYSAVGPTTHLAARMEQLATPGSVRLTLNTLNLAEGFVQVNRVGPIPVKGLDEPVEVFELTGASETRRRLQASMTRGLSHFVGRETEMETLIQALSQAHAGHGQVVAVVGEAGVGKSRLFYEFVHSHRAQAWRVLESSAVSYGQSTSYLLIADLLKGYFQIEDRDTTQHIREKVTGRLLTLDEQLKDAIPPLLSLLDALPEDDPLQFLEPPHRQGLVQDALKQLLLSESQRQPLLLVFEDLHWMDAESQSAIDTLIGSLPTNPILILTNYRPKYEDPWISKMYYTRLRVDPLPSQNIDALLDSLLGADGSLSALKALLKERTGGNPFFLEESIRSLSETAHLSGQLGVYQLASEVDNLQLPATVQALLAARIDRLPPVAKQLLQSAAVIGADVPLPLLKDITELSEGDLQNGLADLQEAEFLYETRLFPDPEYTFKHALTYDVAYESLLHERRRQLHRQVGQAIETRYPDRLLGFSEMLASQFERGENWDKAAHYHLIAAEKVKAQYAYQMAVTFCSYALALASRDPNTQDIQVRGHTLLGDLRSLLGDVEQANQHYDDALQTDPNTPIRQQIANKIHRFHTVVRDGANIVFYEHGSGDHTLILAHPVTYGIGAFQPLVEKLCQEFRVITIEPRGDGASDPRPPSYLLRDHAKDVRAVIERVSPDKPIVGIGMSRGGTLMTILAAVYPELVDKLVLISSLHSPKALNEQAAWAAESRALLLEGKKEQAMQLWADINFVEPGTQQLADYYVRSRLGTSVETLLEFTTPGPEDDVIELLPQIQAPTLVMHGTADRRIPLWVGHYLAKHIPGAQFYPLEDKGHTVLYTAANQICEAVRHFIRTGSPPPTGTGI